MQITCIGASNFDVKTLSQHFEGTRTVEVDIFQTIRLLANNKKTPNQLMATLDPSLRHINITLLGKDVSSMALYETPLAVSCNGPFCVFTGNLIAWQSAIVTLCHTEPTLGNELHQMFISYGLSALWANYHRKTVKNALYLLETRQ